MLGGIFSVCHINPTYGHRLSIDIDYLDYHQ